MTNRLSLPSACSRLLEKLMHLPQNVVVISQPMGEGERERDGEREPMLAALAYEDMSMLESSAKMRMAAKQ